MCDCLDESVVGLASSHKCQDRWVWSNRIQGMIDILTKLQTDQIAKDMGINKARIQTTARTAGNDKG
jgi:hypothetical protein